jgi:hypothetical protein
MVDVSGYSGPEGGDGWSSFPEQETQDGHDEKRGQAKEINWTDYSDNDK